MHVVVIGSGIAGITFAEEFRKAQPAARITVLTQEHHGYYSRPMLSHGFAREDVETKIILRTFADLRAAGIEMLDQVEATGLARDEKCLVCRGQDGEFRVAYDKLVLAPGSDALIPPPFRASAGLFMVLNSLSDLIALRRLRTACCSDGQAPHWAVVGGGLIGCEVASDLAKAGDHVTLFHALDRLMERQLMEEDSATLLRVLREMAIEVRLNAAVRGFAEDGGKRAVELADESIGGFDCILVACGFKPRTDLGRAAGLETNRGIRVDALLRTTDPDIHAIGDAAECADGRLYAFVLPIRNQAAWLAKFLAGGTTDPWQPPAFKPRAKVHGFVAAHPYL